MNPEFMESVNRELHEIQLSQAIEFKSNLSSLISDLREKSRLLSVNLFNSKKLTVDNIDMELGGFLQSLDKTLYQNQVNSEKWSTLT